MIIKYLLNEEGRKDSLLKGGDGKQIQTIEVANNEDGMKIAHVSEEGAVEINVGFKGDGKSDWNSCVIQFYEEYEDELGKYINGKQFVKYFDRVMSADKLIDWEKNRLASLTKVEMAYQSIMEERNKKLAEMKKTEELEYKAMKEEKLRKEEKEIKERKKKMEELISRKNKWIAENGSQYLKDANELGYDIDDTYMIERTRKEFPEFIVDINDNASFEKKSNPSKEAVTEVKALINNGLDAEVIELTKAINEYEEYDFQVCEAIVIKGYFQPKYWINIIKKLN